MRYRENLNHKKRKGIVKTMSPGPYTKNYEVEKDDVESNAI